MITRVAFLLIVLIGAASPANAKVPAPAAAPAVEVKPNDYADETNWLCRSGLRQRLSGGTISFEKGLWYDDVRDAWRSYLQRDNGGRGFVLIGHSQGAYVLTELLKQEIDGKPLQRAAGSRR